MAASSGCCLKAWVTITVNTLTRLTYPKSLRVNLRRAGLSSPSACRARCTLFRRPCQGRFLYFLNKVTLRTSLHPCLGFIPDRQTMSRFTLNVRSAFYYESCRRVSMLIRQAYMIAHNKRLSNAVQINTPEPVIANITPPINGPAAIPSVDSIEAPR